jgi:hypothetical protein
MSSWTRWPSEFTLSSDPNFSRDFPNLKPHSCKDGISASTPAYNCIAWAANSESKRWWEPDPYMQYFWPDGAPREYTVGAYIAAFRSQGFEVCDTGLLEGGIEKIVLYLDQDFPMHAARQLPDGNWTSKMGGKEDICHDSVECLNGPSYGAPSIYMKRNIKSHSS